MQVFSLKVALSSPKVLLLTFKSVTFASWKLNFCHPKVQLSPDDSPTFAEKRVHFRVIMQKPCTRVSRIKIFVSAKIATLPEPLTFFGYEFSIRIYSAPALPDRKNLFRSFVLSDLLPHPASAYKKKGAPRSVGFAIRQIYKISGFSIRLIRLLSDYKSL